jgi:hypothetical protein
MRYKYAIGTKEDDKCKYFLSKKQKGEFQTILEKLLHCH